PPRPGPGDPARGAAADVRAPRRGRIELPGSGGGDGHLHRHRHEPFVLRPPEAAGVPGPTGQAMRHPNDVGGDGPSPGQLAAFVDGALDPAASRQVEAWLAAHPEAAAEVEAQRRLAALWRATPAPAPDDAA